MQMFFMRARAVCGATCPDGTGYTHAYIATALIASYFGNRSSSAHHHGKKKETERSQSRMRCNSIGPESFIERRKMFKRKFRAVPVYRLNYVSKLHLPHSLDS